MKESDITCREMLNNYQVVCRERYIACRRCDCRLMEVQVRFGLVHILISISENFRFFAIVSGLLN